MSARAGELRVAATAQDTLPLAVLFFSAALIHLSAAVGHAGESPLYAVLFNLLALVQHGGGVVLLRSARPQRSLLLAGAVLCAGVLGVWLLSRTTGLPLGPTPGRAEAVGPLDVLASIDELAVVLLTAALLGGPRRRAPAFAPGLAATLAALSAVAFCTVGHAG